MKMSRIEDEWSDLWFNFIRPHLNEESEVWGVCENPFLTLRTIRKNIDFPWSIPKECPGDVFPKEKLFWDWEELSRSHKMTIEELTANSDLPWDWSELSRRFKWEEIQSISLPWDRKSFIWNPTVPLQFIEGEINWAIVSFNRSFDTLLANWNQELNWELISKRRDLPWEIVESHPDKPWDWRSLSANPNLNIEIIRAHRDKNWDWQSLAENPALSWETIIQNLDLPWLFSGLSFRHDLDLNFVLNYFVNFDLSIQDDHFFSIYDYLKDFYRERKWEGLSANPNVSMDFICQHPSLPWNRKGLSENPNLTLEFVLSHHHLMNWKSLSKKNLITFEFVQAHPNLPWDGASLVQNRNIPSSYLIDNFKVDRKEILKREDMSFDLISKMRWNSEDLQWAWMPKERQKFINENYFRPLILFLLKEKETPLDLVDTILSHF